MFPNGIFIMSDLTLKHVRMLTKVVKIYNKVINRGGHPVLRFNQNRRNIFIFPVEPGKPEPEKTVAFQPEPPGNSLVINYFNNSRYKKVHFPKRANLRTL